MSKYTALRNKIDSSYQPPQHTEQDSIFADLHNKKHATCTRVVIDQSTGSITLYPIELTKRHTKDTLSLFEGFRRDNSLIPGLNKWGNDRWTPDKTMNTQPVGTLVPCETNTAESSTSSENH